MARRKNPSSSSKSFDIDDIELMLEKMKNLSANAERRIGHIPPRQDPEQIRTLHRAAYQSAKTERNEKTGFACRQTFCGDMYCSQAQLSSLSRINIRDMRMEMVHKGMYLLVRICEPCFKMSGIMAVVEDLAGDVSILSIYNYIRSESIDVEKLLPVGTVLAIKEPYYKYSNTNSCVIRVDSPSDVIILYRTGPDNGISVEGLEASSRILPTVTWTTNPKSYSSLIAKNDLIKLKEEQLEACGKQNFYDAVEVSSWILRNSAIVDDTKVCVYQLRSFAYFATGQYERAFKDLAWTLEKNPSDANTLVLAAQTLCALRKFVEAQKIYEKLCSLYPGDEGLDAIQKDVQLRKCAKRVLEQTQGRYDLHAMLVEAGHSSTPRLDCADYIGPVKVVKISNSKTKMVVTKNVEPGTLLLACKAYEIVYESELAEAASAHMLINFNKGTASPPARTQLATKIALKMMENPSTSTGLYSLPLGSSDTEPSMYADDVNQLEPIADVGRILQILTNHAATPELLDESRLGVRRV